VVALTPGAMTGTTNKAPATQLHASSCTPLQIFVSLYMTQTELHGGLLLRLGQGLESEVVAAMDEGRVALGG
jgi:hypothetical protein